MVVKKVVLCSLLWAFSAVSWGQSVNAGADGSALDLRMDKSKNLGGKWSLSTGLESSSGTYGLPVKTKASGVNNTLRYQRKDGLELRLSFGEVAVNGAVNQTLGSRTVLRPEVQSGKSDIVVGGFVPLKSTSNNLTGLNLNAKFGGKKENTLLTSGENDYSIALESLQLTGSWIVGGYLGVKKFGAPEPVKFKTPIIAGSTLGYQAGKSLISLGVDYRGPLLEGAESQKTVSVQYGYTFNEQHAVSLYAIKGLTDQSADRAGGLVYRYTFAESVSLEE